MRPLKNCVFGGIESHDEILKVRGEALSEHRPEREAIITYVEGRPCWGEGLVGISIHAVRSGKIAGDVQPICGDGDVLIGRRWERNGAEFLMLQNMHGLEDSASACNSREAQANRMFDKTDAILKAHGGTYHDVVRTWIYLSDILDWYDQFNTVRNEKYRETGIMRDLSGCKSDQPILLPASTGIAGDNPSRAACVMDVLAIIAPPDVRPKVQQMTNVKQEDAFVYGSAFSRGACVREPDVTCILISGTAAIDEKGQTFDPGDVGRQIWRTFDTVEALIAQKGASFKDICDANIFLKRPEDLSVYRRLAGERGIGDIPGLLINADVCRRELLFEMDGVAIVPR